MQDAENDKFIPYTYTLHQLGILGHSVEDCLRLLEELVGGVELLDEALVQHHDLVVVQDGVQPVIWAGLCFSITLEQQILIEKFGE